MKVWLMEKRRIGDKDWEIDSEVRPQLKKTDLPLLLTKIESYSRFEFRAVQYESTGVVGTERVTEESVDNLYRALSR